MPIEPIKIQRTLREVGRIRCGDQTHAGKGKAPRKLTSFRFTSDDPELLTATAERYGGKVEAWPDAPGGPQWQNYSTTDRIPVMMVPNLRPITQWMELWSGGGCQRRCNGITEQISGKPCLCNVEGKEQCKPTTRLSLILPEIPGLGVWRLESKGYWAAVELGGITELISRLVAATGEVVNGTLRLQQRQQKIPGQPTRQFAVPVLDLAATLPQLAAHISQHRPLEAPERPPDGQGAGMVQALASGPPEGHTGLPDPEASQLAEDRAAARLAKKRTPEMGPGRRRGKVLPTEPWAGTTDSPADEEIRAAFDNPITDRQLKMMQTLFRSTGLENRDERLMFSAKLIGRSISSSKDLTSREASIIIDVLASVDQGAAEYVTDVGGAVIGAVPTAVAADLHDGPLSDEPAEASELEYREHTQHEKE